MLRSWLAARTRASLQASSVAKLSVLARKHAQQQAAPQKQYVCTVCPLSITTVREQTGLLTRRAWTTSIMIRRRGMTCARHVPATSGPDVERRVLRGAVRTKLHAHRGPLGRAAGDCLNCGWDFARKFRSTAPRRTIWQSQSGAQWSQCPTGPCWNRQAKPIDQSCHLFKARSPRYAISSSCDQTEVPPRAHCSCSSDQAANHCCSCSNAAGCVHFPG